VQGGPDGSEPIPTWPLPELRFRPLYSHGDCWASGPNAQRERNIHSFGTNVMDLDIFWNIDLIAAHLLYRMVKVIRVSPWPAPIIQLYGKHSRMLYLSVKENQELSELRAGSPLFAYPRPMGLSSALVVSLTYDEAVDSFIAPSFQRPCGGCFALG
jgi:hypothetical protein